MELTYEERIDLTAMDVVGESYNKDYCEDKEGLALTQGRYVVRRTLYALHNIARKEKKLSEYDTVEVLKKAVKRIYGKTLQSKTFGQVLSDMAREIVKAEQEAKITSIAMTLFENVKEVVGEEKVKRLLDVLTDTRKYDDDIHVAKKLAMKKYLDYAISDENADRLAEEVYDRMTCVTTGTSALIALHQDGLVMDLALGFNDDSDLWCMVACLVDVRIYARILKDETRALYEGSD